MSSPADAAVTRYLCAGAYLDPDFALAVVDELATDPSRGVAPAPGVDVPAVVRHALAAVRRTTQRDAALTLVLLLAAIGTGLRGVIIVAWLTSLALLFAAVRNLLRGQAGKAAAQAVAFVALSAVFLVVLLVLHERSRKEYARPIAWSGWLPFDLATVGLVIALLWVITFLARIARFAALAEQLGAGRFDPAAAPREAAHERDRLAYLTEAQGSVLSMYSVRAPHAPFVGLGPVVHAWSAATRLADPDPATVDPGGAGTALTVVDVYRQVQPALSALAAEWSAGGGSDLVVAPGSLPAGHPFLTGPPARPVAQLPPGVVAEIAARAGHDETYYQVVRLDTHDGRGGLVGLVHLRIRDEVLSADVAVTALPPVDPRFRDVDAMPAAGAGVLLRTLGAAFADVFRLSYRAPGNLARAASAAVTRRAALTAKPANASGRWDFGARRGLREMAATSENGNGGGAAYEISRGVNRFGRTVVDAIAGALAGHGLDTREFTRSAELVWPMSMAPGPSAPAGPWTGAPAGRERS